MALKDIPAELRERKIWMLWLSENGTKIPYRTGGGRGSSTDPQAWTSFEMACKQEHLYTGIALAINYPYTGIDLDGCLDADGQLADWAAEIVEAFRGLAYCEISPSGTGLKLITRARKPDGARCVAKMGEGKCQVEIYDQGRFWAMTGNVWQGLAEIGDGSEALRGLCERLWPAAEAKPVQMVRIGSVSDLADRARQYVERVPGEVRGNLRNAAFKLAGNLHAFVGDSGERLSDADVEELLTSWNQRNSPPLRQDELAEATVNGRKNGTLPADKVPGMMRIEQDSEVDISGILAGGRSEPEPEREKLADPGAFPADLEIPGLIGELIDWNLRTAHYPLPELAMAGALALMSTITGGKVENPEHSRTNLYIVGLAPSGGGKDHSRRLNRQILRESGAPEMVGPERFGSHAGIVSALDAQWCQLFQVDEIAHLIMAMQHKSAPHLANISSILMQVYSSVGEIFTADAYGDRAKVKQLHYPHAVIYGSAVPEGFWEAVSEENLKGGLIGRTLVFESPKYVARQKPERSRELPASILTHSRAWVQLKTHGGNLEASGVSGGAHPKMLHWSPDAEQRLDSHGDRISDRRIEEDPVTAAIWSRASEKTNKIAMLFACSRFDGGEWPQIELEDAERAIRLNNWLTRKMLWQADRHVSQSDFHRNCNYVLRKLQETPGQWMALGDLTRKTRRLNPRDRRDILQHLLTEGTIEAEDIASGGRPGQRFRAKS